MKALIAVCCTSLFIGCATKPEIQTHDQSRVMDGIVLEKRTNVKSFRSWNAPSNPYYILDMGYAIHTCVDGDKKWQEAQHRSITLRPSDRVSTADLQNLKGQRVSLRGHHVEGTPYQPSGDIESHPVVPVHETDENGNIKVVGSRPANRGSGFVVTQIIKREK